MYINVAVKVLSLVVIVSETRIFNTHKSECVLSGCSEQLRIKLCLKLECNPGGGKKKKEFGLSVFSCMKRIILFLISIVHYVA